MFNSKEFARAVRLKGYGSYRRGTPDSEIQAVKTVHGGDGLKVRPTVLRTLADYLAFITRIEDSYLNPVFFPRAAGRRLSAGAERPAERPQARAPDDRSLFPQVLRRAERCENVEKPVTKKTA